MIVLKGPDRPVNDLVFAPDGASLYTVQDYVGVWVWNLADRTSSELLIAGSTVHGQFAIHAGGRWALGRRPVGYYRPGNHNDSCVIDLTNGTYKPFNFSGVVGQHIAFSPDGKQLVTVGHSDYDTDRPKKGRSNRLYGWKMTAAGPRYEWHLDTAEDALPWRIVFADNDTLVSEDWVPDGPNILGSVPKKPRLCVRSAATGEPQRTLDSPTKRVEQLLVSPDGKQVVVRGGTNLWIHDAHDWQKPPVAVEGKHWNQPDERAACFHPTQPYLLLANNGQSVLVFDTSTWKQVRKWTWKAGTLRACAISADGALAAAAGPHGNVVVWDLDL